MIGQTISHYNIIEKLGSGGMGVVYKAEDTKLKRTVALKFLPTELTRDEETKKRFIHEAQAASALQHTNVCTIHDIDQSDEGQLFICMDYYEGETLNNRIEQGPLKIEEALNITIQIAQGLNKAHEQNIIHRDIKPANILLTKDAVVKIVDFGLAKLAGQTKLTKEGTTLGTVAYMSPEQTRGEEVDHRSDIWSLGVMLYEMVTGQVPFKGDYDQAVMYAIINEDPEPLTGLRSGVSLELERIVNRALAKDPQDRYQHADDLLSELNRLKKDSDSTTTPAKVEIPKKKRKYIVLPAIVLSIVVLIIAGYFFFGQKAEGTNRIPIAVIDFVNETDESELDGLSGMLITSLEQSRRLSVLTRSRMFDILKQLKIEDTEQIDEPLGRKICNQAGVNTLAMASIRKFGKVYSIDFKVLDVEKNEYMFTAKEQGEGQESIPAMIDNLSEKTRIGLKEKAEEIQAASRNVADVTTKNLEAYQHYFKGEEYINKLKFVEAEEELKKAISLDSTFGLAYYRLAYTLDWEHSPIQAKKQIEKAVKYIDKIPDKERYLVRAVKAIVDSGWGKAALKILREMEQVYPNDKEMLYNIGDISWHVGYYHSSKSYLEKVIEIDPTSIRTLLHLIYTYHDLGLYDRMLEMAKRYVDVSESEESFYWFANASVLTGEYESGLKFLKQYRELHPDCYNASRSIATLHLLNEQYDDAEKELETFIEKNKPTEIQHLGYDYLARFYPYVGKYRESVRACDKVIDFFWQNRDTSMAAYWMTNKALYTIRGWNDKDATWKIVEKTLPFQNEIGYSEWYWEILARLYAYRGDYVLADNLAEKIKNSESLVVRSLIYAEKHECNTVESFVEEVLQKSSVTAKIFVLYHHARCLFEDGQFDKAKKRLLHLHTIKEESFGYRAVYFPKSFYLLGKIYEEKGDRNQAIKNYEKFLKMWKNADKDLPQLIDAKDRLLKLSHER